ncbi:Ras-like GTP-binding protein rho1 [Linderina pennispora]|nr:Ras-like GTP-binding protein rho1 [Linderina pennispora]
MIVVGDGACGKTCLLYTFREGQFPPDNRYIPTVFDTCVVDIRTQGKRVELSLWDTAGQEEFDRLRLLCYPGVDAVIICFSVDSPDSLENVTTKWYVEACKQAPRVPIVVVALKADLKTDPSIVAHLARYNQTPVTYEQGRDTAAKIGAAAFVECSSIRNLNVKEVFETAAAATLETKEVAPPTTASDGCCIIL